MKVTIDSAEPLADALRVVGAVYDVTLAQVDDTPVLGAAAGNTRTSRRSATSTNGSSRRTATSKSTQRAGTPKSQRSSRKATTVSTSDIRKWAQAHGHAVSGRGTLPAKVKTAYAEAHKG
jgi:hypothetical protein